MKATPFTGPGVNPGLALPASDPGRPGSVHLRAALRHCRKMFAFILLFSACLNLLFIAPTIYMLQVYNRVVPTEGKATLLLLTIVLAVAIAALSILDALRSRLLVRASARLERELSETMLRIGLRAGTETRRSTAIRDLDHIKSAMSGPAILALCDAPWTPVYILVCFMIHFWVGVLALGGTLVVVAIAWINNRATEGPLWHAANAATVSYASYESSLAAAPTIAALGMTGARVMQHLEERNKMVALQTNAALATATLASTSKFVRLLLQSLALGLAALLAIQHQISGGAMFAAMFMVGRSLAPVDQLLGSWKTIALARGALRNVASGLDSVVSEKKRTQLPRPAGALSVTGLMVEEAAAGRVILNAISCSASTGEMVAVIGPNGAGKSTFIRALAGAQPLSGGTIRFDGADQMDWDPEQLATSIGYMGQDAHLFAGSIGQNIARFRPRGEHNAGAVDHDVITAAIRAGAHEMIKQLPGGYDHLLAEHGQGLSTGQAQQIALARALFGSPSYLLLDEPNSHLDFEGDIRLAAVLGKLKADHVTMLIVTHKLNLLGLADKILLLDGGGVRLFGPREEVMRAMGLCPPRAVPREASAA